MTPVFLIMTDRRSQTNVCEGSRSLVQRFCVDVKFEPVHLRKETLNLWMLT